MKQALHLQQGQRLQLSTQLQQSIRLLQLSREEIRQEITSALESNPLLEEGESDALPDMSSDADLGHLADALTEPQQRDETFSEDEWRDTPAADRHWEHLGSLSSTGRPTDDAPYDHEPLWESRQDSLSGLLLEGLSLHRLSDSDQRIAQALIGCLDGRGYLTATYDEVRQVLQPEIEAEDDEIDSMLHLVQSLSDPGIGARDLAECLTLQLNALPEDTPDLKKAQEVIHEHLALLGSHRYEALAGVLDIDTPALAKLLEIIQSLDPKPGERLAAPLALAVTPDVLVHRQDDAWTVKLEHESTRGIRISDEYQLYLDADDQTTRKYLKEHLREAQWFIRSLQQRDQTILSVAAQIVSVQRGFMDEGDKALVPLTLKDIAQALDIHESTVSRAVDQKYLLTPHGLFPLKHFFSTGLATASGSQTSSRAAQAKIRKMIESEPPLKPISDSRLAAQLEKEGISIARRTVAKYREQMNIPPASQRKSVI